MAQKSEKGAIAEAERLRHIEQWQQSDLEKDEFCEKSGISVNQLNYWQQLVRTGKGTPGKKTPAFARVTVAKRPTVPVMPALAAAVRLVVGGGAVLEIDGSVDPIWAARVIAAVGGRQ